MDDFSKYESLQAQGASPKAIYLTAKADGLDNITLLRLLRRVCGLSLVGAKEVAIIAEQRAPSLDAHQESLEPTSDSPQTRRKRRRRVMLSKPSAFAVR